MSADVQAIGRIKTVPVILEAVVHMTKMRFAAVARVTDTTWVCCAARDDIGFGLAPGDELVLQTTICNEIRQHHQPVVFGHASKDIRFAHHPTPKKYGFESYLSIPIIRSNGEFFGTLCALDPLPAQLDDPHMLQTLELFAQLIASSLDAEELLLKSHAELAVANERGKLRDQFIAVLGHDLRNPLAAISMASELLEGSLSTPADLRKVGVIRGGARRMGELITNILDFARGKLGGGIAVALHENGDLADELRQVVSELQLAHSRHDVTIAIALDAPVICDPRRIGQLLGNLLANALIHGDGREPVQIHARSNAELFELTVTNSGPVITEQTMTQLFEPFTHGRTDASRVGLGLGLYIATEIAKAHGGTLQASSDPEGVTRFTFRMPCRPMATLTATSPHGEAPLLMRQSG